MTIFFKKNKECYLVAPFFMVSVVLSALTANPVLPPTRSSFPFLIQVSVGVGKPSARQKRCSSLFGSSTRESPSLKLAEVMSGLDGILWLKKIRCLFFAVFTGYIYCFFCCHLLLLYMVLLAADLPFSLLLLLQL